MPEQKLNVNQRNEHWPEDAAVVLKQLRKAGFLAGNQDIQERLTTDSNEPGHTTLTEEEIVETVTLPDCEDNEEENDGIADTPPFPQQGIYNLINKLTLDGGTG